VMSPDDKLLLLMISRINQDSVEFGMGILDDTLTHNEQICFAHRLIDLAEAIRERAEGMQEVAVIDADMVECPPVPELLSAREDAGRESTDGAR
jgi:hypothetical protein